MKKVVEPVVLTEVAAGIVRVCLPLPFRLNHVNCYLIQGDGGWTILDTGINTSLAREGWRIAFAELGLGPNDIDRLIISHVHPDHFGLAGWLQEWLAGQGRERPLPVYMSAIEHHFFQTVWQKPGAHLQSMKDYFIRGGMPEKVAVNVAEETGRTGLRTLPHPVDVKILHAGDEIDLGSRKLQVYEGNGHSPGVLLLHDPVSQELFCSDHMLIKITPHIGFWPNMEDEPLTGYMASLRELQTLPVAIAYPGHRDNIENWAERLNELLQHHEARLEATLAAVPAGSPQTVAQIATTVFRLGDLNAHEMRFAMAETWSHIIWLVKAGRLAESEQGVTVYYQRPTGGGSN